MTEGENQSRYPQHDAQKAGAGFPIMRLVAIMSLTTGGIIDYAVGAYKGKGTGEHALLRQIKDSIHKDDIVMGDRYFPCFFVMGDLQSIGADGIFKAHSQRKYDFRKGRKLGSKNHLVIWKKPHKPDWMTQETYDSYPDQMTVREFKIKGEVRKRRYLGRYFAHPMMQNRRAKRDDYKPSAVRVTQRYVP
ncbi:hypothetical protein [Piscirickettsia salmonis]|nr:hypothetical protein [Piscirickettsia salmonis]QHS25708.1 hypothetical protein GW538_06865 [Piscirickettsia salmonis]QHS29308.1 hypothetical protein GW537_09530 [Piscirickettsia salmonis]